MNLEKYTDRSQGFLQNAEKLASRNNNQFLVPAHLLKVILEDKEGMASNLLSQAGANPDLIRSKVDEEINALPSVEGQSVQLNLSQEMIKVFDTAEQLAEKAKDTFVSVERLLPSQYNLAMEGLLLISNSIS